MDDLERVAQENESSAPEAKPRARAPRMTAPKPRGDARVTVVYNADISDNETENNHIPTNAPRGQNNNGFPRVQQNQIPLAQTPQNKLAELFGELADYDSEQTFYALLTRRIDFFDDDFRSKCTAQQNFAPFPITANSMMQFIPTIQKHNGNSGGRFDIVVVLPTGEPTGIEINHFVVPNPMLEPIAQGAGEQSDMLQIIMQMQQKSDERFAQLLLQMQANMRPPEKDRLAQLMEKKIENEIMNPQTNKGFDASEVVAQIFTAQTMVQTLSEKMAEAFNTNKDAPPLSTIDKLLGNEMVVERGFAFLGNIAQAVETMATQKRNAPQPPPQAPPQYQNPEPTDGYPPLDAPPPAQAAAPEQDEQTKEIAEMITGIIEELESDRPIDDNNAYLNEQKAKYEFYFKQIKMMCNMMSFDDVFAELDKNLPDVFNQFYDASDELNERGVKIESRLREFYYYMKGEPVPTEMDETGEADEAGKTIDVTPKPKAKTVKKTDAQTA